MRKKIYLSALILLIFIVLTGCGNDYEEIRGAADEEEYTQEETVEYTPFEEMLQGDFSYFAGTYISQTRWGEITIILNDDGSMTPGWIGAEGVPHSINERRDGTIDLDFRFYVEFPVASFESGWNMFTYTIVPEGIRADIYVWEEAMGLNLVRYETDFSRDRIIPMGVGDGSQEVFYKY
ncbi:MAG: hypothetical protein FWC79_08875 [Oscillospiraceae bacterium]|nr:hypothetical protein [Oscillospiraceae bacterium]